MELWEKNSVFCIAFGIEMFALGIAVWVVDSACNEFYPNL